MASRSFGQDGWLILIKQHWNFEVKLSSSHACCWCYPMFRKYFIISNLQLIVIWIGVICFIYFPGTPFNNCVHSIHILGKYNCKMSGETFTFWDSVPHILEDWGNVFDRNFADILNAAVSLPTTQTSPQNDGKHGLWQDCYYTNIAAQLFEVHHVTGGFPSQRSVTWRFDVFFDLGLSKRLSKQLRHSWLKMPSRSSWRQCNGLRNRV